MMCGKTQELKKIIWQPTSFKETLERDMLQNL
jgi:hypothetical protein